MNDSSYNISEVSLCLNPAYIPQNAHFFYKSDSIDCVKRGPWPIIYIRHRFTSENILDTCIQVILQLSHYGLIKISEYFRFNSEAHYQWLFQNINEIVSITEITVSFSYYGTYGAEEVKTLSRVQTNYLRNRNEWSVYSINNYLPKRERSLYSPVIQKLHIDTHNCQRFLKNMYILNSDSVSILTYFSSFIIKSWRRHSYFLYPLPPEFMRSGRIKHTELPKKIP